MLPTFRDVTMLILKASRGTMKLKLWDENAERPVRFKDIGQVQAIVQDDAGSIVVHNRQLHWRVFSRHSSTHIECRHTLNNHVKIQK